MRTLKYFAYKYLVAVVIFCGVSLAAQAELSYEVVAGIELPVAIGAMARVNMNDHYYGRLGYGYVVPVFSETMGSLLATWGQVGPETGKIITNGLEGANYLDFRAGYDLKSEGGIYLELGYSVFLAGAGSFTVLQAEAATGSSFSTLTASREISVISSVHNLTVHAGYSWLYANWTIAAEAGLLKPLFSNHSIEVLGVSTTESLSAQKIIKEYFDDKYQNAIWMTTASLWGSYSF